MKDKIVEYVKHHKEISLKALIVFVLILIAIFFAFDNSNDEEIIIEKNSAPVAEEIVSGSGMELETVIWVDVSGQVAHPGVLELKSDTRVFEALESCGGLLEQADTSTINMAAKLHDEDKIYIPKVGEPARTGAQENMGNQVSSHINGNGLVNINTASSQDLQQLSGVGPSTAEKIISYRTSNGRFASIEDIKKVSGIGDITFAKFKEKICI